MTNKMRIIHLPTSVGGHSWGLSRGERAIGLSSDVLVTDDNWLHYPADRILFRSPSKNKMNTLYRQYIIFREVLKIRKEYDIFHFNFGSSLMDYGRFGLHLMDLPLYKNKGKIVVTYNGCDARQKYPTIQRTQLSACHFDNCYGGICREKTLDKIKKEKIEKFDRYADVIFALNPDLLYFLPERAQFLPYAISWNDLEIQPINPEFETITIAHAPTNRGCKGTDIILEVLNKIKAVYQDRVKVILIENVPHADAIKMYSKTDLVIDQILVGWYGGLAVECMKMGKPVIAYLRHEDLSFLPKGMAEDCKNTIIQATPVTLFNVLVDIVEHPELLEQYRKKSIEYVYRWHNPEFVAKITKKAYDD